MDGTISLLIPTRKRPEILSRCIGSFLSTAAHPNDLDVIVRYDDDDEETEKIAKRYIEEKGVNAFSGPDLMAIPKWRECYAQAKGRYVMLCGDDLISKTNGWDDSIRKAFAQWPDDIGFVYCNDNWAGEKLSTHFIVSKQWVAALGYYLPNGFQHNFMDDWMMDVAKRTGRIAYLGDVIMDHHAPQSKGHKLMDDVYKRGRATHSQGKKRFEECEDERKRDAEEVMTFIALLQDNIPSVYYDMGVPDHIFTKVRWLKPGCVRHEKDSNNLMGRSMSTGRILVRFAGDEDLLPPLQAQDQVRLGRVEVVG